jgi:hypothetical protein
MASRRKTGQKPRVRQPLKMDKLPMELLDRVMKERAAGRTWSEIEELSPRFEEWEKNTKPEIRAKFPGLRLPHSTLTRWHDLRVEQVKKEVLADQVKAREFAGLFAGKEFKDLPETVRAAISDQLFGMMQNGDEKSRHKTISGLLALGALLNEQRKVQLKERQIQTDERSLQMKIDLIREKVEKLKKGVEGSGGGKKKQLSPEELKQRVDEIYGLSAA